VDSLYPKDGFASFGNNRLNPAPSAATLYQIEGQRRSQLRARVRQECPRHPGVYGMVNAHGELIYVGKAKSLRARLLGYFRPKGRDPKANRILRETRGIVWEYVSSDFAALLRELEVIRRWRPAFNVQGQPRRFARTFICLGRRPAPHLFLTRRPPRGALGFWGPVFAGQRSREAVQRINDYFGLRDCPQPQEMIFAEQAELFPMVRTAGCIRHEIGTCLGPCAGACTRPAYMESVRAAKAFLDGTDLTPLARLRNDMQAAAAGLAFESAAILREKLAAMQWLQQHLERVREATKLNHFIYPVRGHNGQDIWYLIRRGWVAAAVPAPCDPQTRQQAAEAIDAIFLHPHSGKGLPQSEEIDGLVLVSAWFRRYPRERKRTLTPTVALAVAQATSNLKGS
jgi:excinuclease ABC subunit C